MAEMQKLINELFGINNDTSAPIIITLIVFLSGYLIAYFIKFITGILNRRSQRKLFYELLDEIASCTLVQAKNFEKFVKTLEITFESGFELEREDINHLSNLNKLNFESIHKAFFTGIENWVFYRHSRNEFNKVWSGISKLNYWETIYYDEVNKFINKFNVYENKRNELLDKFRVMYDTYNQSINGVKVTKEFRDYFVELQEKVKKWSKIPNFIHYHIAQVNLVLPVIEHNNNHPEFEISLQLNNVLLEVSYYYENLKNLLETYKKLFQSYEKIYSGIGNTIKRYI